MSVSVALNLIRNADKSLVKIPNPDTSGRTDRNVGAKYSLFVLNLLTPELNPSTQRCLTRFFTGDFAS
jgi:hypothetical protein